MRKSTLAITVLLSIFFISLCAPVMYTTVKDIVDTKQGNYEDTYTPVTITRIEILDKALSPLMVSYPEIDGAEVTRNLGVYTLMRVTCTDSENNTYALDYRNYSDFTGGLGDEYILGTRTNLQGVVTERELLLPKEE